MATQTRSEDGQARAAQAAEALAAEGTAVTARAVRERAQVAMTIAAAAAKEWNETEAEAEAVPEVPSPVVRRFEAAWRQAVFAAREEFAAARDGWAARLEAADQERTDLAELVEQLETDLAAARKEIEEVRAAASETEKALHDEVATYRSRADRAEARAEALTEERDRLITERDTARKTSQQVKSAR